MRKPLSKQLLVIINSYLYPPPGGVIEDLYCVYFCPVIATFLLCLLRRSFERQLRIKPALSGLFTVENFKWRQRLEENLIGTVERL